MSTPVITSWVWPDPQVNGASGRQVACPATRYPSLLDGFDLDIRATAQVTGNVTHLRVPGLAHHLLPEHRLLHVRNRIHPAAFHRRDLDQEIVAIG